MSRTEDNAATCPGEGTGLRVTYASEPLTDEDIRASALNRENTFARDTTHNGICVLDGMGLHMGVDKGALVTEDGMGSHRRSRRFDKATHGLSRVVIIGTTGTVTLDALTWCRRLGIGVFVLAPDGSPVLASTPRMTDDARLRRTQARASDLPVGLDLARWLLSAKMTGQAQLVATRFDDQDAACSIADLADALDGAGTVEAMRSLEASAASLYWRSWAGRPECAPRFVAKDRGRIPPHWTRYEGRRSVLASGNANRKAERPVNGLLNYAFALLEAEAILACQVVGLDPGLGLAGHTDTKGRQSLALDLMEPVRPQVEAFVLDLLEQRTFRKVEFTETPDGHCRLKTPLTHELAETMPLWAKAVAPIAETVAHTLGRAMDGKYEPATPLTTRRHRDAQAVVKARRKAASQVAESASVRQRPSAQAAPQLWSCPDCGGQVTDPRHVRCDACIAADPGQAPEVRSRRGQAISARKRALREWEEANPGIDYDPDYFAREILPRLQGVKLTQIMEAAGASKSYASTIRSGRFTPHVSTWRALQAVTKGNV